MHLHPLEGQKVGDDYDTNFIPVQTERYHLEELTRSTVLCQIKEGMNTNA